MASHKDSNPKVIRNFLVGDVADKVELVIRLIEEAAELLEICQGQWEDSVFTRRGGRIVVDLAISPKKNHQYGRTFSLHEDSNDENEARVAAMLAGAIFANEDTASSQLGERADSPLVILPSHASELLAYRRKLVDEIKAGGKIDGNKFDVAKLGLSNESSLDKNAETLSREDVSLLAGAITSFEDPLLRMDALFTFSRLQSLSNFILHGSKAPEGAERSHKKAFSLGSKDHSEFANALKAAEPVIRATFAKWTEALKKIDNLSHQRRKSIFADAEALSLILALNKELSSANIRCVLISGSPRLREAVDILSYEDSSIEKDFTRRFLRHPRAFMASERFFDRSVLDGTTSTALFNGEFDLLEFLNLFFAPTVIAHFTSQEAIHGRYFKLLNKEALDKAVKHLKTVSRGNEDIVHFFGAGLNDKLSEWKSLLAATGLRVSLGRRDEVFRKILGDAQYEKQLEVFRNQAWKDRLELHDFPQWFGLSIERIGFGAKRAPWLHLDCKPEAARYITALFEWIDGVNADRAKDEENTPRTKSSPEIELSLKMREASNALASENDQYFRHTIHASAFAHIGQWQAARTLCDSALLAKDNLSSENQGQAFGREAAYLAAICSRRLAESSRQLAFAKEYLEIAIKNDEFDLGPRYRAFLGANERLPPFSKDPRFISEEIAQSLHELMITAYLSKGDAEEWVQIAKNLFKVAGEFIDDVIRYREKIVEWGTLLTEPKAGQRYFDWIETQSSIAVINIVMLSGLPGQNRDWMSELQTSPIVSRAIEALTRLYGPFRTGVPVRFEETMLSLANCWMKNKQISADLQKKRRSEIVTNVLDEKRLASLIEASKHWVKD
jgi:hypothetical protein